MLLILSSVGSCCSSAWRAPTFDPNSVCIFNRDSMTLLASLGFLSCFKSTLLMAYYRAEQPANERLHLQFNWVVRIIEKFEIAP